MSKEARTEAKTLVRCWFGTLAAFAVAAMLLAGTGCAALQSRGAESKDYVHPGQIEAAKIAWDHWGGEGPPPSLHYVLPDRLTPKGCFLNGAGGCDYGNATGFGRVVLALPTMDAKLSSLSLCHEFLHEFKMQAFIRERKGKGLPALAYDIFWAGDPGHHGPEWGAPLDECNQLLRAGGF